jgi:anti-sigma factor RsiW
MTCREFIEFLMDYLNDEVPPDERRIFEQHLGVCDACRNYLATYQQSIALAKEAAREQAAPSEMPAELMKAILAARAKK